MPLRWRPVGPLPAAVYWRRRAVALAVVAALVLGVWWVLAGGQDRLASTSSPAAEPSSAPSPTASPTAPTGAAVPVCPDAALEVQASAADGEVAAGAAVRLSLTVRNTSSAACRRALGQAAVELVVTSGSDRVWSSDDCEPGGQPGEEVLQPGSAVQRAARWPGTRSAPGCPAGQPAARPGTYRVTGRVGDLRVPGQVFQVVPAP